MAEYIDDLRAHERQLWERMQGCENDRDLASLSRQWLKVRAEIEQRSDPADDDMDDLIGGMDAVR